MAKLKSGYGRGTGRPHPIDIHVGARLRARRTLLGMNQTKLGEGLGVSFQQVQKYERGTNRIGSSRLFRLTRALDVSIEYFFEDMPAEVEASSPTKGRGRSEEPVSYEPNPMAKRETLELVRAYYKIEDADVRKRVYELTKTLGAAGA
jgi:transcriptional regulator with XRE-family HTH domain